MFHLNEIHLISSFVKPDGSNNQTINRDSIGDSLSQPSQELIHCRHRQCCFGILQRSRCSPWAEQWSHAELSVHLRGVVGYERIDESVQSVILCALWMEIAEVLSAALQLSLLSL